MAGNTSTPIFTPPVNSLPKTDPQIEVVDLNKVDWAARTSQQHDIRSPIMGLKHVENGR